MKNYENFTFKKSTGENVQFFVRAWSGPKHWGHVGYVVDGSTIKRTKIEYLNRTWESYRFQSLLYKLADLVLTGEEKTYMFDQIKNR